MPAHAFYTIKAKANRHAEVRIYTEIGDSWWSDSVAAKDFVAEFDALDVDTISLRINSPGGSMFDGHAIANAISRHPATVTAYVDGLAASIASIVAIAADRVVMAKNALMMIHKPWGGAVGSADEIRKYADVLDKLEGTLVGAYVDKTGQSRDAIVEALAEETWYDAEEAVAFGLADEIDTEHEAEIANVVRIDARAYARLRNTPDRIAAALRPRAEDDTDETIVDDKESEAADANADAAEEQETGSVTSTPEAGAVDDERLARVVDLLA